MLKLLGYSFFFIGLAGMLFFINYDGKQIPVQALWFVLSLFIMGGGILLIIKHKWREMQSPPVTSDRLLMINQLRLTGDKVRVTLDNAEVRTRSYQREIINTGFPSQMEMIDGLYDEKRNYKTEENVQTYIVFYKKYGDKTYKFISQATMQRIDILRHYIDSQGGIDLYIDKANPKNYYFDFIAS